MGPLVPDIIGNELNFLVAFVIGIAFGFILEQAGFSTSKKLVGLFYGYDFTVLRVFFTAGITAMLGLVFFGYMGWIDMSYVYVNPTFLWSALVGGGIMGLGFVIGGFCPGTSVCAAAIGKIDAMWFIAGSFIGVLIFAEGYPMFEGLYKAENWGNVTMFDTLNIPMGLFSFMITAIAILSFWATSMIEKKVNGESNKSMPELKNYIYISAIGLVLGIMTIFMPTKKDNILDKANNTEEIKQTEFEMMDSDELAFRLIDKDKNIQIIDIRDTASFNSFNLPNSINTTLEGLFDKEMQNNLRIKDFKHLFVAENEEEARKAAFIADKLNVPNVILLAGGLSKFKNDIIKFDSTNMNFSANFSKDSYRFRKKASIKIPELIAKAKNENKGEKSTKPKRVVGGC